MTKEEIVAEIDAITEAVPKTSAQANEQIRRLARLAVDLADLVR